MRIGKAAGLELPAYAAAKNQADFIGMFRMEALSGNSNKPGWYCAVPSECWVKGSAARKSLHSKRMRWPLYGYLPSAATILAAAAVFSIGIVRASGN